MAGSGFPKSDRILHRSDYLRVSECGKKLHTENFIIVYAKATGDTPRIGITVSRKSGNAVARNRGKRLIREFYRQNKDLFCLADYNIISKKGINVIEYKDVARELTSALQRIETRKCS